MIYVHAKREGCTYLLQYWETVPTGAEPPTTFIRSDIVRPLERRAERLIRGRRFKLLRLVQWNEQTLDYRGELRSWPE
jgi:hypothetical protein